MDVRAHSTIENSVWSAIKHMRLKVLGLLRFSQPFCSCRRRAVTLFFNFSSSWSQRRNSITRWGIMRPCGDKGLEYSLYDPIPEAAPVDLPQLVLCRVGNGRRPLVKSLWCVANAGLPPIVVPLAWIKAFLCCLRARSRLYMGPNLFLPPRIRSSRTADETNWYI